MFQQPAVHIQKIYLYGGCLPEGQFEFKPVFYRIGVAGVFNLLDMYPDDAVKGIVARKNQAAGGPVSASRRERIGQ